MLKCGGSMSMGWLSSEHIAPGIAPQDSWDDGVMLAHQNTLNASLLSQRAYFIKRVGSREHDLHKHLLFKWISDFVT